MEGVEAAMEGAAVAMPWAAGAASAVALSAAVDFAAALQAGIVAAL
jgi:hypothetical protein